VLKNDRQNQCHFVRK